jgi:hypothetical protein
MTQNPHQMAFLKISLFINTLFFYPFFLNGQIPTTSEQNQKFDKVRNEYVKLYQENDSAYSFNITITKVEVVNIKTLNYLGSYNDWNDNKGFVWLFFNDSIKVEFQQYLDKVLPKGENKIEMTLRIRDFRMKQYMLTNSQGCHYRFDYELRYLKNGVENSVTSKNNLKIEGVNGPKELLDVIKTSLWELLAKGVSKDN